VQNPDAAPHEIAAAKRGADAPAGASSMEMKHAQN